MARFFSPGIAPNSPLEFFDSFSRPGVPAKSEKPQVEDLKKETKDEVMTKPSGDVSSETKTTSPTSPKETSHSAKSAKPVETPPAENEQKSPPDEDKKKEAPSVDADAAAVDDVKKEEDAKKEENAKKEVSVEDPEKSVDEKMEVSEAASGEIPEKVCGG